MSKSNNSESPTFAEWLIEARGARGWSQEETAAAAGVTQAFVSSLERGARAPSRDVARAMSKALYVGDNQDAYERFEDRALIAAGYVPSSKTFTEALDFVERYHNLPLRDRRLIQQILETGEDTTV